MDKTREHNAEKEDRQIERERRQDKDRKRLGQQWRVQNITR